MANSLQNQDSILVLGAGELGTAIVNAFISHEVFQSPVKGIKLGVLVRPLPSDATTSTSTKAALLDRLRTQGVHIETGDLENDSEADLATIFRRYSTIIDAGGMARCAGTQMKITKAVLDAAVDTYIPWHFGVDYDTIGPEAGDGLFKEQCEVRRLLRSQQRTKWLFIPCGIFMSFLFNPIWGVVKGDGTDMVDGVSALGKWDDLITATTVEDIGACTAQLVLVDTSIRNTTVWLAGDSITYTEFADMLERVCGRSIKREVRTVPELRDNCEQQPDNKLNKYYLVFAEAKGIAWKRPTYDQQIGLKTTRIEDWFRNHQTVKA